MKKERKREKESNSKHLWTLISPCVCVKGSGIRMVAVAMLMSTTFLLLSLPPPLPSCFHSLSLLSLSFFAVFSPKQLSLFTSDVWFILHFYLIAVDCFTDVYHFPSSSCFQQIVPPLTHSLSLRQNSVWPATQCASWFMECLCCRFVTVTSTVCWSFCGFNWNCFVSKCECGYVCLYTSSNSQPDSHHSRVGGGKKCKERLRVKLFWKLSVFEAIHVERLLVIIMPLYIHVYRLEP